MFKKLLRKHIFTRRKVKDLFHEYYYGAPNTWQNTRWLNTATEKTPLDLWIYQEILSEIKPDIIVECGTYKGGTALFLASICGLLQHGEIISIDIETFEERPQHPRITYLTGSSTSQDILEQVKQRIPDGARTLVILDSCHKKDHVLEELRRYNNLVTTGSYLIVEDTNINGHPVCPTYGPGPMEAVEAFLQETDAFAPDKSREKFLLTFNPNGYLKKIK